MDARLWITGEGGEPRSVALGGGPRWGATRRRTSASTTRRSPGTTLEIELRGGVLMATDLDSRNGTALNGEPLDRPRRLRDGDVLTVADYRLEVSDPVAGRAGATVAASEPAVELSAEERATAAALVAPYRSEGAFAGRPATRAELAEALHVSERTAQRRLDALAREARRARRRRPRAPPPRSPPA